MSDQRNAGAPLDPVRQAAQQNPGGSLDRFAQNYGQNHVEAKAVLKRIQAQAREIRQA